MNPSLPETFGIALLLLIGTGIPLGIFFGIAVGLLAKGDHDRETGTLA